MLGNLLAQGLSQRLNTLLQFERGLKILESHVSYAATLLPDALSAAAGAVGGDVNRFLSRAADYIGRHSMTAAEAWRLAFEETLALSPLEDMDRAIILGLGGSLGMTDRSSQLRNLAFALERLRLQEAAARERESKGVKMYRYLGALTGVALALLLC